MFYHVARTHRQSVSQPNSQQTTKQLFPTVAQTTEAFYLTTPQPGKTTKIRLYSCPIVCTSLGIMGEQLRTLLNTLVPSPYYRSEGFKGGPQLGVHYADRP